MSKVMMIGMGRVGQQVLEYLSLDPKCPEIVICDRNDQIGPSLVDNALIGAASQGLYPNIRFRVLDLTEEISTIAQVLAEEQPDIVVDMTVLMPMHGFYKLPQEQFDKIYSANFGVWLPCQVALVYRLQQAIRQAGIHPFVIDTGLPDNVNPALATVGLAPTFGAGNININAESVRMLVARKRGVPAECVKVYLVSHHALVVWPRDPKCYDKTPYYIRIMVNDRDVTEEYDTDQLIWEGMKLYPAAPSTAFYSQTSLAIIKNMYALMSPAGVFTHVPGPLGLPGGYPVIISNRGVELALPQGISQEEAVQLNMAATRQSESFADYKPGGECVWADYAYDVLHETLGIDYRSFNVHNSYEVARDLMTRYKLFAAKYGVE